MTRGTALPSFIPARPVWPARKVLELLANQGEAKFTNNYAGYCRKIFYRSMLRSAWWDIYLFLPVPFVFLHHTDIFLLYRIDELFLDKSTPENAYRLETFRSTGAISATASQQLRCYFVTKCNFPSKPPALKQGERTDIREVSDSAFLDRATKNTLDVYQQVCFLIHLSVREFKCRIDYMECRRKIRTRYWGFRSRRDAWT